MAKITGGEMVVRMLARAGVRDIFALHGAHLETIFQSCRDHDINLVDTRHEAAAGHAAEGYARVQRGLGVALVTAGPGFTNVITSIANAYLDRTPVLYLTGSAAHHEAETNTLQAGIDQVAVARPITKWAHQIAAPEQLPRLLAHAIRIATAAPTGPVLLDLPMNVLISQVEADAVRWPQTITVDAPAAPPARAVEQAIDLLLDARRPVLMIGKGVWQSDAGRELRAFVETTGIPVYSDFDGHGVLPSSHPLYGGTFHKLADLKEPGNRPDVVFLLGVRTGLFTLGATGVLIPADARIIHADVDAKEIGRLRDVSVGMVADSREILAALCERMISRKWPDWKPWRRHITGIKSERKERLKPALARPTPPIHPYQAVAAIADNISADTTVIGDGAEAYHWLNETIRQEHGGGYITHSYLGAVGFGLGLAIGVQTARPGQPVLCLAGDGAIGFNLAEFDTLVRKQLPVVVVIMNNGSWGASQHFQEIVSGPQRVTGTTLGNARYHEVAAGFGCFSRYVDRIEDLAPAIRAAFAHGGPACINVAIDVKPLPPELELLMGPH
jgi:acetolactate synthase-1/2/3 large subunit